MMASVGLGIEEFAAIGNGRSAALVSRDGCSIDWLCWPRFDSPSVFAALVDGERAGSWRLCPAGDWVVRRRYLPDTNVLETRFAGASGGVTVTDAMPIWRADRPPAEPRPEQEIIRLIACDQGVVELVSSYEPRPDYGSRRPELVDRGPHGIWCQTRRGQLVLRGEIPHALTAGGTAAASVRLRAGASVCFSLSYGETAPAVLPPLGAEARAAVAETGEAWRAWAGRVRFSGPYRDAVMRSALVLKLLTYAPSGAIIAAPTTSLPERIGGDLNWDYRFCWLRDASLTTRALLGLGYNGEAEAFVSWLLHTTTLTQPALAPLYDVFGRPPTLERTLDHLCGHRQSRPVRIGNAASLQSQLDVYGEVIDAVAQLAAPAARLDRRAQALLVRMGGLVRRSWHAPDSGIWELRGPCRRYTHSLVLCWVALDRLLGLFDRGLLRGFDAVTFRTERDAIRCAVEAGAWDGAAGSYVSELGGRDVDASILLLARYGFEAPGSVRMRRTYECVRRRLGAGGPLFYRFTPERVAGEGAFAACSFWAAEYLARGGGTADEASGLFEAMLGRANDVGLYPEELDPSTVVFSATSRRPTHISASLTQHSLWPSDSKSSTAEDRPR